MKIFGVEFLVCFVNIFVGLIEVLLMIKFYVKIMINLELYVVMIGGFVIVVGGVLVVYIFFGVFVEYLIVVLVMLVFAVLVILKILLLEIEEFLIAGIVRLEVK